MAGIIKTVATSSLPIVDRLPGSRDDLPMQLALLISDETRDENARTTIDTWLKDAGKRFSMETIGALLCEFQAFCVRERYVLKPQWVSVLGTIGLLKPLLADCPAQAYGTVLLRPLIRELTLHREESRSTRRAPPRSP